MNVFFSIILIGSVISMLISSPENLIPTMMRGAEGGVSFALKLFLIYAIWTSILKILEKSGADKGLAKALNPLTKSLFKDESEEAYRYINLNLSANLLGMGGAATPMGIRSMEAMSKTKNRVMLVVINSCSIQLIPTTIISLRADAGARADILIPSLIVNVLTTAVGIILVKILQK